MVLEHHQFCHQNLQNQSAWENLLPLQFFQSGGGQRTFRRSVGCPVDQRVLASVDSNFINVTFGLSINQNFKCLFAHSLQKGLLQIEHLCVAINSQLVQ